MIGAECPYKELEVAEVTAMLCEETEAMKVSPEEACREIREWMCTK